MVNFLKLALSIWAKRPLITTSEGHQSMGECVGQLFLAVGQMGHTRYCGRPT